MDVEARTAQVRLYVSSWGDRLCMAFVGKEGVELCVTFSDADPPEDVQRYLEKYYLKQEGRYWVGKMKLFVEEGKLKVTFVNDLGGRFTFTILESVEEFKRYIEEKYLR